MRSRLGISMVLPGVALLLLSGCGAAMLPPALSPSGVGSRPAVSPVPASPNPALVPEPKPTLAAGPLSLPERQSPMSAAADLPEASDPIGQILHMDESIGTDPGRRALEVARRLLGTPYVRGGHSPAGFDCSGLVLFSFRQAGVELPRSSREQYRYSQLIEIDRLQPGDLLFFQISRQQISHVGIFVEADRFIHAPSKGKQVSYATLSDPYWRQRLVGAGRITGP
ncbi:MAG: C40 family peptidase [Desulfuromonadales bacterium]|nr:C40 family peptidase [Desulfuromonadales bacterium]